MLVLLLLLAYFLFMGGVIGKAIKKNVNKEETLLTREQRLLNEEIAKQLKRCAPHKWQYDETGRMKCEWCKNHPFEGDLQ